MEYNEKHGITPKTIIKDIREIIEATKTAEDKEEYKGKSKLQSLEEALLEEKGALDEIIAKYQAEMMDASNNLQFERAAYLRDKIKELKKKKKNK